MSGLQEMLKRLPDKPNHWMQGNDCIQTHDNESVISYRNMTYARYHHGRKILRTTVPTLTEANHEYQRYHAVIRRINLLKEKYNVTD